MWLPLHTIQKVHKVNDNITNTIHDNLPEISPSTNGISSDRIPELIVPGSPNPDYNKLKIIFALLTT